MSWQKLQSNTAIIEKKSEFLGLEYGEKTQDFPTVNKNSYHLPNQFC
jgi:hypothetical protein